MPLPPVPPDPPACPADHLVSTPLEAWRAALLAARTPEARGALLAAMHLPVRRDPSHAPDGIDVWHVRLTGAATPEIVVQVREDQGRALRIQVLRPISADLACALGDDLSFASDSVPGGNAWPCGPLVMALPRELTFATDTMYADRAVIETRDQYGDCIGSGRSARFALGVWAVVDDRIRRVFTGVLHDEEHDANPPIRSVEGAIHWLEAPGGGARLLAFAEDVTCYRYDGDPNSCVPSSRETIYRFDGGVYVPWLTSPSGPQAVREIPTGETDTMLTAAPR